MTALTRALRAALVVLLATAGLAAAPAVAAPASAAADAAITGRLTDVGTGLPIPNAYVVVATTAYEVKGWTTTDFTGGYTLGGLESGTAYVLSALPPAPYALTWLPGPPPGGVPQSFVAPAVVDAALSADTRISGTLRDTDGSPAANATVQFDDGSGSLEFAYTDENGAWSRFVRPGTYVIQFSYDGRVAFAYGTTDESAAARIVVGGTPVVVDDTLPPEPPEPPATTVAGRVTDAVTGAPVTDVCPSLASLEAEGAVGGSACTDANGDYVIEHAAPGTWAVQVEDEQARYATARTAPFTVAAGDRLTGKDVALEKAGSISGLAVDSRTGTPLADVCPSPFAGRTDTYLRARTACSDASGRWRIDGLPAGKTTVQLGGDATHAPMWVGGVADQVYATQLTVTAGATADAGTVRLRAGGVVTGRVTNQAGQPVGDTWVELGGYSDRCGFPCGPWAARTDADGRYRISNVEPQRTIAAVVPVGGQPYAVQWSGGATDPVNARKLAIRYETTTRLDAVLAPEATLDVTVTGLAGDEWAMVDAVTLSGAGVGFATERQGDGTVTVRGLPASKVKLTVTTTEGGTEAVTWYGGTSLQTAREIAVAPGKAATATVALPG